VGDGGHNRDIRAVLDTPATDTKDITGKRQRKADTNKPGPKKRVENRSENHHLQICLHKKHGYP
jgi:hypothetical protein